MSTRRAPAKLACSRSKADFLDALGLKENDNGTDSIYKDMMSEAAEGRDRVCEFPDNLKPDARESGAPYSFNDIVTEAIDQEVLRIYYNSSSHTRAIYDLGREWRGRHEDNWIVRWCLWHVFRYRDDRNRSRGVKPARQNSGDEHGNQNGSPDESNGDQRQAGRNMYDPIRDV